MTCQEAVDVMGDFVDERLQPSLRRGFDEHMAECKPCATYLQHLYVMRGALRQLPEVGGSSPNRGTLIEAFKRAFGPRDPETPQD